MTAVIRKPDTQQKLEILSADAQYDLACACGTREDEHRKRGAQGKWIYPVTLPNGGRSVLFKTLISNVCTNDCKYCPLRADQDVRRCTLGEEETVNTFLDYFNRRRGFRSVSHFRRPRHAGRDDGTAEPHRPDPSLQARIQGLHSPQGHPGRKRRRDRGGGFAVDCRVAQYRDAGSEAPGQAFQPKTILSRTSSSLSS